MRLEELFSDDLCTEYELQKRYIDCIGLLNDYNSKTEVEILEEMLQIWKTWEDGKGKAKFLLLAGMDMQRAHNILTESSPNKIKFEDYIRFKAVGKDYAVIEQKYKLDEQSKYIRDRIRRMKNKQEDKE